MIFFGLKTEWSGGNSHLEEEHLELGYGNGFLVLPGDVDEEDSFPDICHFAFLLLHINIGRGWVFLPVPEIIIIYIQLNSFEGLEGKGRRAFCVED